MQLPCTVLARQRYSRTGSHTMQTFLPLDRANKQPSNDVISQQLIRCLWTLALAVQPDLAMFNISALSPYHHSNKPSRQPPGNLQLAVDPEVADRAVSVVGRRYPGTSENITTHSSIFSPRHARIAAARVEIRRPRHGRGDAAKVLGGMPLL